MALDAISPVRDIAGMEMRDARRDDLPAILAMLVDDELGSGRDDASDPFAPGYVAAFEAITADPNQRLIVAEQDGTIVGTMQLSFLPGLSRGGAWRLQIEEVRIAGSLRGGGLGSAMIEWAIARGWERGACLVQLSSHASREGAHRFYERLGFAKSHVGMKRAF